MKLMKLAIAALGAIGLTGSAQAVVNLVANGDFEQVGQPRSRQLSVSPGEQYLTDWTNGTASDGAAGYNFYALPGIATLNASDPAYNDTAIQTNDFGVLSIWGANNGGRDSNMFTGYSPTGGNFLIADGDFRVAPISQMINGLVVGQHYNLSFVWAAGQQYTSSGRLNERWIVGFGDETQKTGRVTNPNHGFTGWMTSNMDFTATDTSQVLSFLARGSPGGQPPMVFLDHVSLGAVPEPASWTMMIAGFGAIGIAMRRRRRAARIA